MRLRTATASLAAVTILALTGCSSGSDDAAPPPAASTAPAASPTATPTADPKGALEEAVRAYSAAYFKPDAPAAYALLSARCQQAISADVYGGQVASAAKDYGQQAIKVVIVDQISGGLARVSYTYAVPKLDQVSQPWTLEKGGWRYDAC